MVPTTLGPSLGVYYPPPPPPPASVPDPIAARTGWTPIRRGASASFRSRRLVRTRPERMEFVPTAGAFLFAIPFLAMGALPVILTLAFPQPNWGELWLFVLVSPFVAGGLLILRTAGTQIVFDRARGFLWTGRDIPREGPSPQAPCAGVSLDTIHALQILAYRITSGRNVMVYTLYELTLVFEDGGRQKLLAHGDGPRLREDALALGAFLGRPVWDGTVAARHW